MVGVEAFGPFRLGVEAMSVRLFRQLREELGVAPPQLAFLGSLPELLQGVLPNRLEDEEAIVSDRLDEAVVDERAEVVELGTTDPSAASSGNVPEKTERRAKSSRAPGSSSS
jgi:hypothetical protein